MGPRRSTETGTGDRPATKRSRTNAARNAYPRRRAVTACQLCRMRKTKCDNRRPSCGTCTSLHFQCVYQDSSSDFSSFDSASLAILDRVNYAIRLIEQHPSRPNASSSDTPRTRYNTEYAFLLEAQQLQAKSASSSVLQWPSLRDLCDPSGIDKLFFNTARPEEAVEQAVSSGGQGIREEDVPSLIERFLENVHTKNPILDPSELRKSSRCTGEDGFQWDGPSCVILIYCALGTVSRPFSPEVPGRQDKSRLDGRDYGTGESYYTAARKRIGLLEPSIMATQCAFLIGVYEMFSMRLLRAWLSFNRACTFFQTYLHSSSFSQPLEQSSETVRSRLYWSCLKSDCEMRKEIALPPTELAKVEYSDAFPSPPEWAEMPVHHLQRIVEELDGQVVQWAENFPPMFRFNGSDTADELSYFLHARYLAAHSSPQDPNLPIYAQNASLCLDIIFKHILNCSIRHRYHGSWFAGRNLDNIAMASNWTAIMDTCIAGIMYWEDKAPDLHAARLILQHIYQSVDPSMLAFESAIG
ncbi:hypothetical protein BDW62DRAFT_208970 [Aspergillus aurantiobrunneus]